MKTILLVLLTSVSFAQKDFKWEVIDSVAKSKDQIYKDTKIYIADRWVSAQDVIQNDDKENGIITVKGVTRQPTKVGLGTIYFYYYYTIKFMMKESKFRIAVDNVTFKSGPNQDWSSYNVLASDENPGNRKSGLSDKSWTILMDNVKADIQAIVNDYQSKIKVVTKSDW